MSGVPLKQQMRSAAELTIGAVSDAVHLAVNDIWAAVDPANPGRDLRSPEYRGRFTEFLSWYNLQARERRPWLPPPPPTTPPPPPPPLPGSTTGLPRAVKREQSNPPVPGLPRAIKRERSASPVSAPPRANKRERSTPPRFAPAPVFAPAARAPGPDPGPAFASRPAKLEEVKIKKEEEDW